MSHAFHPGAARRACEPALRLRLRGRDLGLGRHATLTLVAAVAVMTLWGSAAGLYFWLHDDLLASLVARQADMQYGYEDQIATLRTELDRRESRSLVDRRTLNTTLRDVDARSRRLEERAAVLDALVEEARTRGASGRIAGHEHPRAESGLARDVARPAPVGRGPAPEDHAEAATLAARLATLEARQTAAVLALREPLTRHAQRLAAALSQAGLSRRAQPPGAGVGGPFVPLDGASAPSFETEVALTRDALAQCGRLAAVADRVPLRRPVTGPLDVSSPFGARLDPFFGRPALHTGVDLLDSGDGVAHATAAGVVTVAGESGGYGRMVEIDHGQGLATRYAHLASIDVVPGQHVAVGAPLGRIGATGRATGPHLHYETRINGDPVDPQRFLVAGARLVE